MLTNIVDVNVDIFVSIHQNNSSMFVRKTAYTYIPHSISSWMTYKILVDIEIYAILYTDNN